jgi:hypothetical protein
MMIMVTQTRLDELTARTGSPAMAGLVGRFEADLQRKHNERAAELRRERAILDVRLDGHDKETAEQLGEVDAVIAATLETFNALSARRETLRIAREQDRAQQHGNRHNEVASLLRGPGMYDGGVWLEPKVETTEAAAPLHLAVRRELDLDIIAGNPARGRAGRIADKLPPRELANRIEYYSVRQVQRVLDTLASVS